MSAADAARTTAPCAQRVNQGNPVPASRLTAGFSLESDQRLMRSLYPSDVGVKTFEPLSEAFSFSTKSGSLKVLFGASGTEPMLTRILKLVAPNEIKES